jgi:hypothetical protein
MRHPRLERRAIVEITLASGELAIRCESDHLVAFGDGIKDDHIDLG